MSNTPQNNDDQIAFWNGPGGQQWAKNQEAMDKSLKPFSDAAIALAEPRSGETILDVGCGCGDTTLMLAHQAGLEGTVFGLDISEPMVARAKERAAALETMGLPSPHFRIGDASTYTFKSSNIDLLFSRFGVMFFADPTAAFANIRKALRPSGRLAFICWQPMTENPFFAVPTAAALTVLPAPAEKPDPEAPGPFAFGNRDRLEKILSEAGFRNIAIESLALEMDIGEPDDLGSAARQLMQSGPVSRMAGEASESDRQRLYETMKSALEPHLTGGQVRLGTKTWLVSARNG